MADFATDIPQRLALAAHSGTSFVPEKRAAETREDYRRTLAEDFEQFRQLAEKCGTLDQLDEEFARYREGYRRRYTAWLASRGRLVSTMIAGPSNFPAARMNKRGEVSHRRLTELLEFQERARAAIRRKLNPALRPIMAGDADAVERLEQKIRKAEQLQDVYKTVNKLVRQKPRNEPTTEKIVALMEIGFSRESADEIFRPDFCGRIGIPGYRLTNNNANIRRMRQRLEQISRNQDRPDIEQQGANATIQDCPAENRVRLFYPGKPAADIRAELKSCGFRWAPSLGCWQAYRNNRSLPAARRLAGIES